LIGVTAIGLGYYLRNDHGFTPHTPQTMHTPKKNAPHVLMVMIDTLRADYFYGENFDFPHAPALQNYAKESLVFTDVEAAGGWTIASIGALFSGLHPGTLKPDTRVLPSWAPSMASYFAAAGYNTHAFVDNAILQPRSGF